MVPNEAKRPKYEGSESYVDIVQGNLHKHGSLITAVVHPQRIPFFDVFERHIHVAIPQN